MVHIPEDVLNDVFSRYILPEAKSNSNDTIRLCFAIEMAHWFYLDDIRAVRTSLPDCTVEVFAKECFKHMPTLLKSRQDVNHVLKDWKDFKRHVPVYGAMMITPDQKHALLVEGNSTRGCWTFPRGKIEENEDPYDCAVREVAEETSFDISRLARRDFYIEKVISDRRVRLYIVHDVPHTTLFYTKVKGEIASFLWFAIDELPGAPGYNKKKKEQFFMVNLFVREYLKGYKAGKKRNNASECDTARTRGSSFSYNDGRDQSTDHYNSRSHPRPHRPDSFSKPDHQRRTHRESERSRDPLTNTQIVNLSLNSRPATNGRVGHGGRGGRSRRGGRATSTPIPHMTLASFSIDVEKLVAMLPG